MLTAKYRAYISFLSTSANCVDYVLKYSIFIALDVLLTSGSNESYADVIAVMKQSVLPRQVGCLTESGQIKSRAISDPAANI